MTIVEATRELFKFFLENDVFNLDQDFNKIVLVSVEEEIDKAIVKEGLKSFEEQKLVKPLTINGEVNHWALNKPLSEYSQTVELDVQTITAIASTINDICDELGVDKGKVNPLEITLTNIQDLILIIHDLKKTIKDNE